MIRKPNGTIVVMRSPYWCCPTCGETYEEAGMWRDEAGEPICETCMGIPFDTEAPRVTEFPPTPFRHSDELVLA